ncbi:MAG: hypothetical protein ABJK11_12565 [Balneola sp.]
MKKIIGFIMLSFVGFIFIITAVIVIKKFKVSEETQKRISNLRAATFELPLINKDLPTIINYFNTTCMYCQEEISDIQAHSSLIKKANILLISNESIRILDEFQTNFKLDTTTLFLVTDNEDSIKSFFGVSEVPATFIYRSDSSLIKSFKGKVDANVLYELVN